MRQIAYIVLACVLLANLIQPLTEMVEVCRKKVIISSALNNSFRAARDRSLEEHGIQNLNAKVDVDLFYEYFTDAFCDSLNLYDTSRLVSENGYIEFESIDDTFNTMHIDVEVDTSYDYQDRETTRVNLELETEYKFSIGVLKLLNETSNASEYILEFDRSYLLLVKN